MSNAGNGLELLTLSPDGEECLGVAGVEES